MASSSLHSSVAGSACTVPAASRLAAASMVTRDLIVVPWASVRSFYPLMIARIPHALFVALPNTPGHVRHWVAIQAVLRVVRRCSVSGEGAPRAGRWERVISPMLDSPHPLEPLAATGIWGGLTYT